jgi:protease I
MRIACLLAEGFEDAEFSKPMQALKDSHYKVTIIGIKKGEELTGEMGKEKATTEEAIDDVSADDFDALLIPGGYSPDKLRANDKVVNFVRRCFDQGKPIMAICHGPQLLLAADRYKGYRLTAWKTIQDDLSKAGAEVVDEEVVCEKNVITSRMPDDLPAFIDASIKILERTAA